LTDDPLRPGVERFSSAPVALAGPPVAKGLPHRTADIADQQDRPRGLPIIEQGPGLALRKTSSAAQVQSVRREMRPDAILKR